MILNDPPFIVYKICQQIVLHLPLEISYKISLLVAEIYRFFRKKDYFNLKKNLEIVFPEKDKREIARYAKKTFRNFARHLIDFLYFPKLNREYIKENIKIEGIENFAPALLKKKGIIVITAHLGSWEVGGAIASILGYPVNIVVLEHPNKKIQNFFIQQREEKGSNLILQKDAARDVLAALKKKQMVVFVNDKDYFDSGIKVKFFGKEVSIPRGTAVFAIKTKSLIVPGFTVREKNRLKLIIEKPISYKLSDDKNRDMKNITQKVVNIIEEYIRRYPGQWFYFEKL